MIFNSQLSKIVVHKKEIESKLCCLWKSLFKRFFQLQYIEACLQMLTAVLSSFYNQDMKAGSVDPRQMRVATAFVKSSGRHLCALFLSVLHISGSHTQTVWKSFHYHYSNLLKIPFRYTPLGHDGNQAPVSLGYSGCGRLAVGDATGQGQSLPLHVGGVTARRSLSVYKG